MERISRRLSAMDYVVLVCSLMPGARAWALRDPC
jgi:hypothetical protein